MTPFILKGCKKLPPEAVPDEKSVYDEERQIWLDTLSGIPVVCLSTQETTVSRYGETTITETREGADQSEITMIQMSRYGETTLTKTQEGADQTEITGFNVSRFGETTVTATREGADSSEINSIDTSRFGETTMTRSREGHDQAELTECACHQTDDSEFYPTIYPVTIHATYSHF